MMNHISKAVQNEGKSHRNIPLNSCGNDIEPRLKYLSYKQGVKLET